MGRRNLAQVRAGTLEQWVTAGSVPAVAELAIVDDTLVIGDGTTAGADLPPAQSSAYATLVPVTKFGAVGDGIADDTAAIQDALDASTAGRPALVYFPCSPGPAAYRITDTLNVTKAGTILAGPSRGTVGGGPRLLWAGAAGGTMLSVDAERVVIENLALNANYLADTCLATTSHRGLQLLNVHAARFTGIGMILGDGTANMGEFYSRGLMLSGLAGAQSLKLDSDATELMLFLQTQMSPDPTTTGGGAGGVGGNGAAMVRHIESNTNALFVGLTLDGPGLTDYAIYQVGGSLGIDGLGSEVPQLVQFEASGRQRVCRIHGDARSLNPPAGEYALDLKGQTYYDLSLRIQRKAGAAEPPNVNIGTTVLGVAEEGVIWASQDAGAVGTYVGATHLVNADRKPTSFRVGAEQPSFANTNWANQTAPNADYFRCRIGSTGAQNASITFLLPLAIRPGTWAFRLFHSASTNAGIYTLEGSPDGATWAAIGTVDGYNAVANTATASDVAGVTVAYPGWRYLRLTMATKNAASSDYYGLLNALSAARTGN